MRFSYETENTCSKEIRFDLNNGIVTNVEFLGGGCLGNLQAVPRLVEGMTATEIEEKVLGIIWGRRGTSCADQLARAVRKATEELKEKV